MTTTNTGANTETNKGARLHDELRERLKIAREAAGLTPGQAGKLAHDILKTRHKPYAPQLWFQGDGMMRKIQIGYLEGHRPDIKTGTVGYADTLISLEVIDLLADLYGVSFGWLLLGRSDYTDAELDEIASKVRDPKDAKKVRDLFMRMSRRPASPSQPFDASAEISANINGYLGALEKALDDHGPRKIGYVRFATDANVKSETDRLIKEGCERVVQEQPTASDADRPELEKLLSDLRAGDEIVVVQVSSLGVSTRQFWANWQRILDKGGMLKSLCGVTDHIVLKNSEPGKTNHDTAATPSAASPE